MTISTHIRTGSAITIAIILVSAASAAGATKQSGSLNPTSISMLGSGNCPLERVGTQLVRCDNLTGAGVRAPSWVPELKNRDAARTPESLHGPTVN